MEETGTSHTLEKPDSCIDCVSLPDDHTSIYHYLCKHWVEIRSRCDEDQSAFADSAILANERLPECPLDQLEREPVVEYYGELKINHER